ncbi:hypothetical protein [Enterococcus wangshanyuanii]|uniref:Uncharacterized protein n=1 Tax=Enterococcus wangshanyuanii TaxID=2005703 RepID=A0ABQ1PD07_9ENTE|nr:hypothetical protein [Enterococcus wangshanyuanii]GGC94823.1 hypothetical protein GCM10011573_25570 [Enterococcus wangshanyuanii]
MPLHRVVGEVYEVRPYLVKYLKSGERYGMKVPAVNKKDAIRRVRIIEEDIEIIEVEEL